MIITKEINIKINNNTYKYYLNLGYNVFAKYNKLKQKHFYLIT